MNLKFVQNWNQDNSSVSREYFSLKMGLTVILELDVRYDFHRVENLSKIAICKAKVSM